MEVNYLLLYGTPYLKTKYFEKFNDISKYLVKHKIVHYQIFELMNDFKEIEMIHLNNDIRVLEGRIDKAIEYIEEDIKGNYFKRYDDDTYEICEKLLEILRGSK